MFWFVMFCGNCGAWIHFDQEGGRSDANRSETPQQRSDANKSETPQAQQWDLFTYQRPNGKHGKFRRSEGMKW